MKKFIQNLNFKEFKFKELIVSNNRKMIFHQTFYFPWKNSLKKFTKKLQKITKKFTKKYFKISGQKA